jgi:hypothetical protein
METAQPRDLQVQISKCPASDTPSLAGCADLGRQIAVPGFSQVIAASWAIRGDMREETGAENLPQFLLVRIGNRR